MDEVLRIALERLPEPTPLAAVPLEAAKPEAIIEDIRH
jgi:hypothetical protein